MAKKKFVAIAVFLSKLDHRPLFSINISQDYSSVGIGFNITNKRHILPIVYNVSLNMFSFNHYCFIQS